LKLILIDQHNIATIAREEVLRDQHHFDVDYTTTFEEFRAQYSIGKYDIAILDFAFEAGAKALEHIDETNPQQRVIVISEDEEYIAPNGCAYCVEHYSRRRMIKPFSVMDLANLIRDFDYTHCTYYRD